MNSWERIIGANVRKQLQIVEIHGSISRAGGNDDDL